MIPGLIDRPALSGDLVFTSHLDIVVWNVRLCLAVAWRCFEPTHDARSSTFSILQIVNSLSRRDVDLWWHRRSGPRIQLVRLIVRPLGPPQLTKRQPGDNLINVYQVGTVLLVLDRFQICCSLRMDLASSFSLLHPSSGIPIHRISWDMPPLPCSRFGGNITTKLLVMLEVHNFRRLPILNFLVPLE
ncbi:hypothetical protein K443DRAFT_339699 [Laccaria amethystina LaAM-08-1]|uniref:Uncharacterized protein n=1 Tax=Laccaria amethystina LaAM-08-1 TaxID=1095629 RepID=A0A0C9X1D7_9AGAR|nr:hypothetical protein K443DRAFT_339699 [Laccaria amethystina LaAM-08-1]